MGAGLCCSGWVNLGNDLNIVSDMGALGSPTVQGIPLFDARFDVVVGDIIIFYFVNLF